MTKSYLAGFIAGTMGEDWEDCPYNESNQQEYSLAAEQWRTGQRDGFRVASGDQFVGVSQIEDDYK